MNVRIGILAGDYIGPEITREAVKVLNAVAPRFQIRPELIELEASGAAYDKYEKHLPAHTLEKAASCDALLKGPFGGPPEELGNPKWAELEREAILPLRKHFDLFTNLRHVKVYEAFQHRSPLKPEITQGVDILFVRELVSGIYFGPKTATVEDGERVSSDLEVYRETEIRRIAVQAYTIAKTRRKKVTLIGKSNVLRSSVLWRDVVQEVAKDFPEIESDYMHIDNAAMQLIQNPRQFDVVLTTNMFGDILSDEASVIPGSIGLLPSACLGASKFAMYEPIHGSAPSIAGQNVANPLSSILCIALLFRHSLGLEDAAQAVESAVDSTIQAGFRTPDLADVGPNATDAAYVLGTREFGDQVVKRLGT